ncbi:hypothetical protein ACFVH0_00655 [Streptomyces sp. NPDC127117]|uniref:hypothetical protein n=1 Tax=Streptomyces sp. NPDC127117 TaxID=3345368 RepID=UPI00362E92C5
MEERAEGAGPFTTRLAWHLSGGGTAVWESPLARRRGVLAVRPPGATATRHTRADAVAITRLRRLSATAALAFVIGGALFATGSADARFGAGDATECARPRNLGRWIVAVNQLGSVLFVVSAIAAFTRPATGSPVNADIANRDTLKGALCFCLAGLLQLGEHS